MAEARSNITTDHEFIRRWVEQRQGRPTSVKTTAHDRDPGVLRIEFPGYDDENDQNLEEIDWESFFAKFDEKQLAFLYQDHTVDGKLSRFFKFVRRNS